MSGEEGQKRVAESCAVLNTQLSTSNSEHKNLYPQKNGVAIK
jgi:hypothetical protein